MSFQGATPASRNSGAASPSLLWARALLAALWELVWAGLVTNDAWHPLRGLAGGRALRVVPDAPAGRRLRRRGRPSAAVPAAQGRWSPVAHLLAPPPAPRERARALAEALLDRHGVVTRAAVLAEGIPGGYSAVYGELRLMEEAGACQRGYFVEGLGGAQFALPAAVERLRSMRSDEPAGPLVLAATDPANPYGAALPWPKRDGDSARRPSRVPGAYVVTLDAEPVLYVERGGKALLPLVDPGDDRLRPALEALADAVKRGRVPRLGVERFDGEPVVGSPAGELLIELGFRQSPRKLTLSA